MHPEITAETLEKIKAANSNPLQEDLRKSWTVGTGLIHFDLEPVAKVLVPENTPFRNRIQRVMASGGNATNWKAVTKFNKNLVDAGVSEGNRGGKIDVELKDYTAAYKGLGLEDDVTFEADDAAENFDDVKELAVLGLLNSVFIEEENVLLGANTSLQLGQPAAPTLADLSAQADGTIPETTTVEVSVIALTHEGFRKSSVATIVRGKTTRTNADASVDIFGGFSSEISTESTQVTATDGNDAHVVTASTPTIKGALAYAWFWGPTAGAGQLLGAITVINSVRLTTAAGTGTQQADDANLADDNSTNALLPDGLIYTIIGAGPETPAPVNSGAFYEALPTGVPGVGNSLTTDSAGGIVEIDRALRSFWDNHQLGPAEIWLNAQQLVDITKLVIASGGSPFIRFNMDIANIQNPAMLSMSAGAVVGTYLNKFTMSGGSLMPLRLHPNIVPGMLLYMIWDLPYKIRDINTVHRVKARREFYQIEWSRRTRKHEFGIYVDEVYQNYAPFAFGVTVNIAPVV